MKTYIISTNESQEEVIKVLAKALQIDLKPVSESDEDKALLQAMEEGKKYGHLSDDESKLFIDKLGK